MPGVQVLVLATNRSPSKRLGDPIQVRGHEELAIHPWGKLERPPFFVVIDIPDAEVADVQPLIETDLEDFVREDGKTRQRVANNSRFSINPGLVNRGIFLPDGVIASDLAEFVAAARDRRGPA